MKFEQVAAAAGAALIAGCAIFGRDPFAERKMNGTWCSLGTSISWYNDNVKASGGRFSRGYQSRVMDVLKFDGFVNPAINGGTVVGQAAHDVPRADYYTVEHGINDWGKLTKVGDMSEYLAGSTNKTFYARYRVLVDKMRAANPKAKIILCTPRKSYGFGKYLPAHSYDAKNGVYLKEYVDAVRAIAAHEGFKVADFYANCGEEGELKDLSIDVALHPNDKGYQRMADELLRAFAEVD
ncbi:MAG: SGNH/GDSL hydrolase family protein [Kiritimatiellae bacterium]|nr:SGNH/GDSL hydrolase family protein [Kiritimatiellia bacterium]